MKLLLSLLGSGLALVFALLLVSTQAWASWSLDNDKSQLSFVTTKVGDVAEVHRFHKLSGSVSDAGVVAVSIQLASVDTLIPIRDERIREVLFEVAQFPTADVSGDIDLEAMQSLAVGESRVMTLDTVLSLRNQRVPVQAEVLVARLSKSQMIVATRKPVVVNAASIDLAAGVEKLREIAGLPSISKAVPASFILTFTRD